MARTKPESVRRPLSIGDSGKDVEALQPNIKKQLDHLKIDYDIGKVDGDYGKRTHRGARIVAISMGAGINNRRALRKGRCPENAQRLIRGRTKTKAERRATKRRTGYRQRTRKKYDRTLGEQAYLIAKTFIGVMEQGGNNVGRDVEKIIATGGGSAGQAWCGWFMAAVYKLAGSKLVTWQWGAVRLLYPLMGIKRVSDPRRGDLVRYTFDHVGMFEEDLGTSIMAIEGNTGASGAVSDSATGGDGVYRKPRSKSLVRDYLRVTR